MDLYIVPQNSFERKRLGLSAKQHSSLAPVNITLIKIRVTDYGLVMHTACARPQRCYLLFKTSTLSFPFSRKDIIK